ncbi:MAG: carboxypeptidase regulatory-like domain-containing protein [Gammaproteobacteria bacterium]|nr:carboxypeptidase regulatory-like domain-containing protein [Gammaproteobacteria bacterium]
MDPDTDSFHIEAPGYFHWFTKFFAGRGGEYDLGEIALERERTITGRVRNARSREPIAGALVRRAWQHHEDGLLRRFTINWFGSRGTETRTDGTFALGLLPAGADRLEVRGRVDDRAFVRVVDLPPGVTHLDIDLAFDFAIAGTLVLPDGTPAEGTVRLGHSSGTRWEHTAANDGVFRWESLGGGEYRLSAESDEGVVESRAVVLGDGESAENVRLVVDPGGRIFGTVEGLVRGEFMMVAVRDRNGRTVLSRELANGVYSLRGIPTVANVTARTTLQRVLTRQVRLDDQGEARTDLDFSGDSRVAGTVRAGGRPLGGVNLAVVPEDQSPVVYATTDELGSYAAEGISDGPHSVQTQTGHSFDVHVEQRTRLDIDLPQNSLFGTVRDGRTGRPVVGGWVRLARADASRAAIRVRVASDGRFRFEGLSEGDYFVRVSHSDFSESSRRVHVAGSEIVEFDLESRSGG